MCGIAGILRVHPPGAPVPPPDVAIPEAWLDTLDDSIKHRGPDGHGRFRDRAIRPDGTVVDVALVHRRMSIIDHAGGSQPMVWDRGQLIPPTSYGTATVRERTPGLPNASGLSARPLSDGRGSAEPSNDRTAVVFNGCIYNHRGLRKELQADGHHFATDHSDTEVLIHGWREWQTDLFDRLEGMFAAVIWDGKQGRLVLARDCFGEKPLYLHHAYRGGAWFNIFASVPVESTALRRQLGEPEDTLAPRSALASWIRFGFDHCGFIAGSDAVAPGYVLDYCQRGEDDFGPGEGMVHGAPTPAVHGFGPWRLGWYSNILERDQSPSIEDFERALESAVRERLEADVELGCFCSGGVDSSLVALLAKRFKPDLRTFTVRMPDDRYDESAYAQAAADAIGTRHTTLDCAAAPAEDLVALIHQMGVPFGDSSLLPMYWLCRHARQHVKVALSGDGGDELFLGYERYQAAPYLGAATGMFRRLSRPLSRTPDPKSRRARTGRLIDAAAGQGYFDLLSIFPTSMLQELVPPDEFDRAVSPFNLTRVRTAGTAAAYDALFYLPCDLMRKSDSASMSVSLEVRSPFLDRRLAKMAFSTRPEILMPGGERKGLLRGLARKYLPPNLVDRPKQGFAIPIGEWFRSDYGGMKQLLLDHLNSAEPWGSTSLGIDLSMKFVRQMLDEHMGTGPSGRIVRDHSQRLYMLLVLSIWAKWMGNV